jgi:hypothetical protein
MRHRVGRPTNITKTLIDCEVFADRLLVGQVLSVDRTSRRCLSTADDCEDEDILGELARLQLVYQQSKPA